MLQLHQPASPTLFPYTTLFRSIAANAPLTVKAVKYIVGEVMKDESAGNVARCTELVEQCFASNDFIEGRRAFMEKRKPAFNGDRKSTRLNSSHLGISYAVFCLK